MATLHTLAIAVLNIKSLVPIVHELCSPHYTRWRTLFFNTLEKYATADQALLDDEFSDDISWKHMDYTVLSWFYRAITPELVEVVLHREDAPPTARRFWLSIECQFLGNKATLAMLPDTEFQTFVQGDLSVA